MLEEKLWMIDQGRITEELVKAFEHGMVTIRDGVAYWAKGSGKKGIIQHLPLKEVVFKDVASAMQLAQQTTLIAAAASTGIILGAIALQTQYLSNKLGEIQQKVDILTKEVQSQQLIYYIDKYSTYAGYIATARLFLQDRGLGHELKGIIESMIPAFTAQRNQVLSFVDNILTILETDASITPDHQKLICNFANGIMSILPFGIHLEHLLAARIGHLQLADALLLDGAKEFSRVKEGYRTILNEWGKRKKKGTLGNTREAYFAIENQAKVLFSELKSFSPLLELPLGKQVEPFALHAA